MTYRALSLIALLAAPAIAQDSPNGLPYGAPGRGEVDHTALVARELEVVTSQVARFASDADALATQAQAYCDGDIPEAAFMDAYRDARLSWAPLEAYHFGPIEQTGAALSVNFWPDRKGFVGRALKELTAQTDAVQRDPQQIAQRSAAAQGFPALETLIEAQTPCPTAIGITGHMAQTGAAIEAGWTEPNGWADLMRQAGPDNPIYLTPQEVTTEIYTALNYVLVRMRDQALARPMGGPTGPQPHRAEAWQTSLSNDIMLAQLEGVSQMLLQGFGGDVSEPARAWVADVVTQTKDRVAGLGMPLHEAIQDPQARWRVDGLRNKITYLILQFDTDIGPELGVETGFSPADGD